jgi:hypothetical protein
VAVYMVGGGPIVGVNEGSRGGQRTRIFQCATGSVTAQRLTAFFPGRGPTRLSHCARAPRTPGAPNASRLRRRRPHARHLEPRHPQPQPPPPPPTPPTPPTPKGANLLDIEAKTGAKLIVADSGEVFIYAPTRRQYDHAAEAVMEVEGRSISEGTTYRVKVRPTVGRVLLLPEIGGFLVRMHAFFCMSVSICVCAYMSVCARVRV